MVSPPLLLIRSLARTSLLGSKTHLFPRPLIFSSPSSSSSSSSFNVATRRLLATEASDEKEPPKQGFFSRMKNAVTGSVKDAQFKKFIKEITEKEMDFEAYMKSRKASDSSAMSMLTSTLRLEMDLFNAQLRKGEAVFEVMTPDEKKNAERLTMGQMERIANASGMGIKEVQMLINEFKFFLLSRKAIIEEKKQGRTPATVEEFHQLLQKFNKVKTVKNTKKTQK